MTAAAANRRKKGKEWHERRRRRHISKFLSFSVSLAVAHSGGGGVLIRGRERQNEFAPWTDKVKEPFKLPPPPPSLPPRPPPWEYLDVCGKSFEERERQTFIAEEREDDMFQWRKTLSSRLSTSDSSEANDVGEAKLRFSSSIASPLFRSRAE